MKHQSIPMSTIKFLEDPALADHIKRFFSYDKEEATIIADNVTYVYPLSLVKPLLGILQNDTLPPFIIDLDKSLGNDISKSYALMHWSFFQLGVMQQNISFTKNHIQNFVSLFDFLEAKHHMDWLGTYLSERFLCANFLLSERTRHSRECQGYDCWKWDEATDPWFIKFNSLLKRNYNYFICASLLEKRLVQQRRNQIVALLENCDDLGKTEEMYEHVAKKLREQ